MTTMTTMTKAFDKLSDAGFAVTSNRQVDRLIVKLHNRPVGKTEVLSALDWQSENLTIRNMGGYITVEGELDK